MWRNLNKIHTRKYLNFTTYRNGSLITRDDSNNSNESDQEKSNASGNQQVLAVKIETRNMKHPDIFRKALKSIISNAHQNDADESHDLKLIGNLSRIVTKSDESRKNTYQLRNFHDLGNFEKVFDINLLHRVNFAEKTTSFFDL